MLASRFSSISDSQFPSVVLYSVRPPAVSFESTIRRSGGRFGEKMSIRSSSSSSLTVYLAPSSGDSFGLSLLEFEMSDASAVSSLPRARLGAVAFLLAVVFLSAAVFLRAFVSRGALGVEGVGGGSGLLDDGAETALSGNGTLASFSRSSRAINLLVNFFQSMSSNETLTITCFSECLELVMDLALVGRVVGFEVFFARNCFAGGDAGTYSFSFTLLTY